MASTDRLAAISDRHATQRDSIVSQLVKLLLGLWGDFGDSRDPDAVTALAAKSATLVSSATSRMRLQARSYNTTVMRELGGKLTLPPAINPYPRSNVSALDVYSRPSTQFIYALSQGSSVDDAVEAATERLSDIAEQDVMLAERDEATRIYDATPSIVGYRRVIHPELSRNGSCGLCVVASQRFYKSGELMPIHGGDNCTTMPIVAGDDPGFRLNKDDLDELYRGAGSKFGSDLLNTRVTINEHGELGPVLVKHGDHFRTPEEAGRPAFKKPTLEVMRKQNAAALSSASRQLDEATTELADLQKQIPADLDYDRLTPEMTALVDRRTTLTRLTSNLRGYVAMLQATAKSL
ncbi:hypothetical protein [Humibacter sp. RRB41]|uniref:hypothetical protein n=1 Tax=Humibacter sp. RRB41 TaxID=2919946 RepID=UPI001FAAB014|nr:hypothetical protein [Humibacter sp. RRB41]